MRLFWSIALLWTLAFVNVFLRYALAAGGVALLARFCLTGSSSPSHRATSRSGVKCSGR
jgi:hypothetical protein